MQFGSRHANMTEKRIQLRRRLDDLPDFLVEGTNIQFRQTFETVEAAENILQGTTGNRRGSQKHPESREDRLNLKGRPGNSLLPRQLQRRPVYTLVSGGSGRKLFESGAFLWLLFVPRHPLLLWNRLHQKGFDERFTEPYIHYIPVSYATRHVSSVNS